MANSGAWHSIDVGLSTWHNWWMTERERGRERKSYTHTFFSACSDCFFFYQDVCQQGKPADLFRFMFNQVHRGLNSNRSFPISRRAKTDLLEHPTVPPKRKTKWGVAGECVQSHHNPALMCEDSGEITRSYPSFITLQKDPPHTLLLRSYSLYCYFFLIFFSSLWHNLILSLMPSYPPLPLNCRVSSVF